MNPNEPVFIPGLYLVEFDRIGRNHDIHPLQVHAESGPDLATQIHVYADPKLGSRDTDVDVCFNGTGFVSVGFQPGGNFTWKRIEAAA